MNTPYPVWLALLVSVAPTSALGISPRTTSISTTSAFQTTETSSSLTISTSPSFTTSSAQAPEITSPPSPSDLELGLREKWHLTTYWECNTLGTYTHCGWHEPVLPGGNEVAVAGGLDRRRAGVLAGAAAVVVGVLMG